MVLLVERLLGELVAILCQLVLSGINGHGRPHIQILLQDLRVLHPLQESLLVFDVKLYPGLPSKGSLTISMVWSTG